jgi:hypothetical protein
MSEIHAEAGDWEEAYNDLHELHVGQRAELAALREENASLKSYKDDCNRLLGITASDCERLLAEIARLRAALTSQDVRFVDIGLRVDSSTEILSRCEDGRREIAAALTGTPSGLAVVPVDKLRLIGTALHYQLNPAVMTSLCAWVDQAIKSAAKEA